MADHEQSPIEQSAAGQNRSEQLDLAARIVAETASDAIITIDENSKILFVNHAAEDIFGYSTSEMLGQNLTMLMPEYLRHQQRASLRRYGETGTKHLSGKAIEMTGLHKERGEIALELSFGEFSKDGQRFFTGIARDVTQRKKDELRLLLQNSITRILSESSSLTDASTKVLETICRHFDWQLGEFWTVPPTKDHLDFVASWHLPEWDVSAFYKAGQTTRFLPGIGIPGRIWATKAPLWFDEMPVDKSFPRIAVAKSSGFNAAFGFPIMLGPEILGVIDFFSHKITEPNAALMSMMALIGNQVGQFIARNNAHDEIKRVLEREHTARLRAEALARQTSALQRVTDAALAMFSFDDLLREMLARIREVLNVDTAAILLLQEQENDLLAWAALGLEEEVERGVRIPVGKGFAGRISAEGKPLIIPNLEHADVYNPLLREKGICSLLGVPLLVEGRGIGVLHVGTFTYANFTDEDVRLLQLVADRIAISIEKARINQREREARVAAEKANLLKDEFLTILSHELRTPLTPIMGWSHMMQAGLIAKHDFGQALDVISKNTRSMKRLVDDLLDMSAILSGKMRIEQRTVSLRDVLRDAVENMSTEANNAGIKLILSSLDDEMIVKGDQARLLQTFSNILHNAIKFTPKGGSVKISTTLTGPEVLVQIRDSGVGIDKEFLPYVFERFRQADGSRTRAHGGLGLGLALVKSFVEAHRGDISVDSEGRDRGTTFSVLLPLESFSHPVLQQGIHSLSADEKAPAKILIVEDQPDTLAMLVATFSARGFAVKPCLSAIEALQVAQRATFDVVISDIAMPEIDGFEMIKRMRQLPSFANIPAVALTGYASEKDSATALKAGFNIHLCKPVDPVELATLVDSLLKSNHNDIT